MNIDNYINWGAIWGDNVCLNTTLSRLSESEEDIKIKNIIKQFMFDNDVELDFSKCYQTYDSLVLCFTDIDERTFDRCYKFTLDSDFRVIDVTYKDNN